MRTRVLAALTLISGTMGRAIADSTFCFETPNPPGSFDPSGDNTLDCWGSVDAQTMYLNARAANISVFTDGQDDCAYNFVDSQDFGNSVNGCTWRWHEVNAPYAPLQAYLQETIPYQEAGSSSPSPLAIFGYVMLALFGSCFLCICCCTRSSTAAGDGLLKGQQGETGGLEEGEEGDIEPGAPGYGATGETPRVAPSAPSA